MFNEGVLVAIELQRTLHEGNWSASGVLSCRDIEVVLYGVFANKYFRVVNFGSERAL
jgi:hypothetical protein